MHTDELMVMQTNGLATVASPVTHLALTSLRKHGVTNHVVTYRKHYAETIDNHHRPN